MFLTTLFFGDNSSERQEDQGSESADISDNGGQLETRPLIEYKSEVGNKFLVRGLDMQLYRTNLVSASRAPLKKNIES